MALGSLLQHVGVSPVEVGKPQSGMWDLSSLTRGWTCIPHIGRQILNHQITSEVPQLFS